MNANVSYSGMTIRQALAAARRDTVGQSYLASPLEYSLTDGGRVIVRNRNGLLGVFEAERLSIKGETTHRYEV